MPPRGPSALLGQRGQVLTTQASGGAAAAAAAVRRGLADGPVRWILTKEPEKLTVADQRKCPQRRANICWKECKSEHHGSRPEADQAVPRRDGAGRDSKSSSSRGSDCRPRPNPSATQTVPRGTCHRGRGRLALVPYIWLSCLFVSATQSPGCLSAARIRTSSPPVAAPRRPADSAEKSAVREPQPAARAHRRVVPLRRRELPALVRDRMLQALVIRLRQDHRDGDIAAVASVVSTARRRRAGSNVRNTGADSEESSFRFSFTATSS